ncbi:luciferin sulfotransferase-like [Lutzomyia longipalpis]|uniref:luciferin sulfotransferase-like n=1 Tax=Lutzomyia longipalpis TaxID=7200 RepID=UPI002483E56E|nr:luciferin sulfotransferase-like [Lutzomyia longipalpis]
MSVVYKKVTPNDLSKKITYFENVDFVRIWNTEVPQNLPIDPQAWQKGYYFPENIIKYAKDISELTVRSDDVWVLSFPKCGTTWTQEMVWQICNDLNFKPSNSLSERYSFLDHLAASLLPRQIWTEKPKIVYVIRNAKDMITSYYHHWKNIPGFSGSFDEFIDLIIDNRINYTPFDSHVINFWHMRNESNVLFLVYEEMQQNLPKVIEKTAHFFGKTLTEEQIYELADHLSFNKMANNPAVNFEKELSRLRKENNMSYNEKDYRFIRKGKVNSFKDEMSPEMIKKVNDWLSNRFKDYEIDSDLRKIVFNEYVN